MAQNRFWMGFFSIIIIIFIALSIFWFWGKSRVDGLVSDYYQSKGFDLKYDNKDISGYPFSFQVDFKNLQANAEHEGQKVLTSSEHTKFKSYLWSPYKLYFASENDKISMPVTLKLEEKGDSKFDFSIDISKTSGFIHFKDEKYLKEVEVELEELRVKGEDKKILSIEEVDVNVKYAKDTAEESIGKVGFKVKNIEVYQENMSVPPIKIEKISGDIDVHMQKNPSNPLKFKEGDMKGIIKIEWGPGEFEITLDLSLQDNDKYPTPIANGTVKLTAKNLEPFIDHVFGKMMNSMQLVAMKAALQAFKKDDGRYSVSVEFKDGEVNLENMLNTTTLPSEEKPENESTAQAA